MKKLLALYSKYKEIILYVFFGGLTTLVNFVFYYIFTRFMFLNELWASAFAVILSILFAYVTNRKWVFNSEAQGAKEIFPEMLKFFGGRAFSAVLDVFIIFITVTMLHFNDLIMKIISNIIVIIINYIISKVFVFTRKKSENKN